MPSPLAYVPRMQSQQLRWPFNFTRMDMLVNSLRSSTGSRFLAHLKPQDLIERALSLRVSCLRVLHAMLSEFRLAKHTVIARSRAGPAL